MKSITLNNDAMAYDMYEQVCGRRGNHLRDDFFWYDKPIPHIKDYLRRVTYPILDVTLWG